MNSDLASLVNQSFAPFVDNHGLTQLGEVNDGETYSIEYASDVFVIRLERYRDALLPSLYKAGFAHKRVGLFNLVAYLTNPSQNSPVADYFPDEQDLGERFRKQTVHIAATLDGYWTSIVQFFSTSNYLARDAELEAFVIRKYPEVFKRC
jgi:hypothetical protein